MRLFYGFSALVGVLVVACASDGFESGELPLPDPVLAKKAGITVDEMGEGYWVFSRKCMECHQAKLPVGEMKGQWHPVVKGMIGNAGLSASEEAAILNYVRATSFR